MKTLLLSLLLAGLVSCVKNDRTKNCVCHFDNPNLSGDEYDLSHGTGFSVSGCSDLEKMTNGGKYTSCSLQ